MQKEVLPSHKLQDHAYEYENPFGLKEDNPSQRHPQNQMSHSGLSHVEPGSVLTNAIGKVDKMIRLK